MEWNQIRVANEDFTDAYKGESGSIRRDHLAKPNRLSAYEGYLILKNAFGPPNSSQFDEDKSQWQYALQSEEAYFEVYDWKRSDWSIAVYLKQGATRTADQIAQDFIALLTGRARQHRRTIAEKVRNAQAKVIENPYLVYKETADSIYNQIEEILAAPITGENRQSFGTWLRHLDLCRAAFILYMASVEGFINLLYELYLKESLREQRIYDRIRRERIDLRIRLAPIYCECFGDNVLDKNAEAFKRFLSLVQLRNDFVHANLTDPMVTPVVHEDDFEFLMPAPNSDAGQITRAFSAIEYEDIRVTKTITEDIVGFVVDAMTPRFRRELTKLLEEESIVVEYEDGQVYVA